MCFNVLQCSYYAIFISTMFLVAFHCILIFCRIFAVLVIFLCKTNNFIVHYSCIFIYPLHHYKALHFIKNVTLKITHFVNTHNVTLFAFFYPIIQLYVTDFKIGRPTGGVPTVRAVPPGGSTYTF